MHLERGRKTNRAPSAIEGRPLARNAGCEAHLLVAILAHGQQQVVAALARSSHARRPGVVQRARWARGGWRAAAEAKPGRLLLASVAPAAGSAVWTVDARPLLPFRRPAKKILSSDTRARAEARHFAYDSHARGNLFPPCAARRGGPPFSFTPRVTAALSLLDQRRTVGVLATSGGTNQGGW